MDFALPYISEPNEIPNEEYHNGERYIEFISSSVLKQLKISPKWLRHCQLTPTAKSLGLEADLKGSVYHSMLASIANCGDLTEFKDEYVVFKPPINPKTLRPYGYDTIKFKLAYDEFINSNPGKEICSETEVNLATSMIKELRNGNPHLSKDINFLLEHGKGEISHFVEYQGGYFKYRTDLKTSTKIIDWKTCMLAGAKRENFARQIVKLDYHVSAAFYQFLDFLCTGRWKSFYWVAQEKEPPYDFNIIDASNWAFRIEEDSEGEQTVIANLGAQIMIRLLEQYLICMENDSYPGYSVFTQPDYKGHRIATSPVPGYAEKELLTFYN